MDHRHTTNVGQVGETALDYLRQVALAFLASAYELGDPLGIYTVGDDGVTHRHPPESSANQYATVRSSLHGLAPTAPESMGPESATDGIGRSPAAARRAAEKLRDGSAFCSTLRPSFEHRDAYVDRIEADPLFHVASVLLSRLSGSLWTVILTDDARRTEVTEAVEVARRGDDNVLVFLAPRVLFEPGGFTDLEDAYARYVAFEEFRRDLSRLDRVSAFEVDPGD